MESNRREGRWLPGVMGVFAWLTHPNLSICLYNSAKAPLLFFTLAKIQGFFLNSLHKFKERFLCLVWAGQIRIKGAAVQLKSTLLHWRWYSVFYTCKTTKTTCALFGPPAASATAAIYRIERQIAFYFHILLWYVKRRSLVHQPVLHITHY